MINVFDNGAYREATAEEVKEMREAQERWEQEQLQNPPTPDPMESMQSQIDDINVALAEMYGGVL